MELGGVKDVVTKVTGRTSNAINVAHATLEAIRITRTESEIRKLRGLDNAEAAQEASDVED
jgi:small subunit ribosomal protein S5